MQEPAFGGAHRAAVGSAKTVADILNTWVRKTGIDGSNLSYAVVAGDLEDHAKLLVLELKARGMFWDPIAADRMATRGHFLTIDFRGREGLRRITLARGIDGLKMTPVQSSC